LIYYFICGGGAPDIVVKEGAVAMDNYGPLPLIMLIPVALVVYIAFVKRDVYIAASIGIVVSTAVGLVSGLISVSDIISFQEGTASGFIVDGFNGMVSIVLVILIMFGVSAIMHASGIFEAMINKVTGGAMCKTTRRTEFTLAWLMTGVSALMGCGQDPALVMLGPVYDEIGQRTGIHPYRRAEIIDAMSTMLPACIPFTCIYLFMISNMTQGYDFVAPLSTFDLLPGCAYCFILFCVIQLSILTGWGRLYEGPNGEPLKADGTVLKNLWSFNNISPSRPCGK
ncbi:MAG: Na+/H+ antiporter NhaC family protein, partial [Eubacteriales bacterium]|nr:Na+/H+ antiporter NhaC family protein [Eubacteriales bacterium]